MTAMPAHAVNSNQPTRISSMRMSESQLQQIHLALEIIGIDRQMDKLQMEYILLEARQPAMRLRDTFIGIAKGEMALQDVQLDRLRTDYVLMVRHLKGVELSKTARECIENFTVKFDAFSKLCFGETLRG